MAVQESLGAPARAGGLASRTWLIVMLLLSLGVGLYGLSYLTGQAPPANIRQNGAGMGWVLVHATSAGFALLLGPWQFWAGLRARRPWLHRWIGRGYLIVCLVGGVSGLILAWNTNAGVFAQAGFGTLAAIWLGVNAMGYSAARRRDFTRHRRWMIRSFALTFAAVTLRAYVPISIMAAAPMAIAYPIISWACWVPNLIVAEIWLRTRPDYPSRAGSAASRVP